ncbi:hypothetical protein V6N13_063999 [Hibiscus sabdariffa]|uniref:Cullin family profile domain-containing protein n=1 Tax=Hibiscus sabdariffa TaxID=183260 RepID=A0ABR2BDT1_9ROSI
MIFHSLISTACNFNRSIHSFYHTEEALKHGSKATNEAIWLDAKMEIKITNKLEKDEEIIIDKVRLLFSYLPENDVFEKYYNQHLIKLFLFSQIVSELLQHLGDLCFGVDALETYVKEVLVYNFFSMKLSPFERILEGIELAKLDKGKLRYDSIKRKIFPNSCLVVYPLSIQRTLELKDELAEKFGGGTQSLDFGIEIMSSGRAHLNAYSIFKYKIFNPWGQGFFGGEGIVMTLENWEQGEGNKGLMSSEIDDIVSFDVKIPNAGDILINHVTVETDHINEHDLRLNDETKMNTCCFTVLGSSRLPQC